MTSWVEFFIITAISIIIIFGAESLTIILPILLAMVFIRDRINLSKTLFHYQDSILTSSFVHCIQ